MHVKRIFIKYINLYITTSGDYVKLKDRAIYINDIKQVPYNYDGEEKSYRLNEDEFFVIGDNYNNSVDSRFFGVINKEQLLGRIINF